MIRELPKIDIGGELYYIDLRLHEFRHVDDFMNRINIEKDLWDTDNGFVLDFDTISKTVFRGTKDEFDSRFGKDVIQVELPPLSDMDPVGYAHMLEQWKHNNPLLVAMIESIPEILNDQLDKKREVEIENMLPRKEGTISKGKEL